MEGEREGEYICVNIPCAISGTYLQGTLSHLSVRKQRDDDAYVTSSKALVLRLARKTDFSDSRSHF